MQHDAKGQRSEKTLRSLLPEYEDSGVLHLEIQWISNNAMQGNSDGVELKYQMQSHPDSLQYFSAEVSAPPTHTVTFCACAPWR